MRRTFLLLLTLGILLALTSPGSPVRAQGPTPQHSDPVWQASYWNNKYLNGAPVVQRSETEINYDWGGGEPAPGIEENAFSARWTRYVDLPAGTYAFTATADDGMRVLIDGVTVLDQWTDHPPTTYTFERALAAGHHLIVVEYYENADRAVAKFGWSPDPASPINHWDASFFNNTSLSGAPVLTRDDTAINFGWGEASPAPGLVNADNFSVRWFRYVDLPAGNYRFTAVTDDGMRVWVNNHLLLDDWTDQYVHTHTMDFYLPGGRIPMTVEYYEHTGGAFAKFSWAVIETGAWRGEYYNNVNLAGDPLLRYENSIFFNWGDGSPAPYTINADNFSARWTRSLDLAAGTYQFWVAADDGVRLWVNNHLLIDQWRDQATTTYGGEIYVPGGSVPVRLEYYERGGNALLHLSWNPKEDESPPAAGEVIVDDGDPGFTAGGANAGWSALGRGFGSHLWWSWNNDRVRTGYQWARWYPDLAAGRYAVFAHIPANWGTTGNARYWVSHADGMTLRTVNQNSVIPRWAALGTYRFRGTGADYVSLSDVTYEGYLTTRVVFDAIKWEPR